MIPVMMYQVLTFLFQYHEDYKSTDHCFHCLCQSPVFKNWNFLTQHSTKNMQQQNVLVKHQCDVFVLYLIFVSLNVRLKNLSL